jgi:hypothetical protein
MARLLTTEDRRLEEDRTRKKYWKRWGPYLSERQWGTVREDYSRGGTAWEYFPHDHARSRAYRWGEDGIGGISDRHQMICFGLALWNGRDSILKERLFGLNGHEGNHGEDVKEYYFYLDSTPAHTYMRMLYKYPQAAFPYEQLVEENRRRGKALSEFELVDTGVFAEGRYFDVFVEYAKADVEDILIKITAINRGSEPADLKILPSIWFRNTWSWGKDLRRPMVRAGTCVPGSVCAELQHWQYGKRWLLCAGKPELLFTENETNQQRLFGGKNRSYVKDAFHAYLTQGDTAAINPKKVGTKMAALYPVTLGPGESVTLKLRLMDMEPIASMSENSGMVGTIPSPAHAERAEGVPGSNDFGQGFDGVFAARQKEADEFYASRIPKELSDDAKSIMRQSFSGMLWCKQFYHYDVRTWLDGDPAGPPPPRERLQGRNKDWTHLYNDGRHLHARQVGVSVVRGVGPGIPHGHDRIDRSGLCKEQLILLLREWYMHPNGQLPAYEWAFGDVNPPVHAWAAWRVYKIERSGPRQVRRPRLPGTRFSQAAAEFHVVGEPQGSRMA